MIDAKQTGKVVYQFGHFEASQESGELFRRGQKVRIQELPFRVLITLLEQPGKIVPRDVLARQLWPDQTFVEFDKGLSTAVTKLRQAIGDVAENPRFVETVPRRGYRFIAPVTIKDLAPSATDVSDPPAPFVSPVPEKPRQPVTSKPPVLWKLTAGAGLLAVAGLSAFLFRTPSPAKAALHANDRVVLADFDNATANGIADETLNSALRVKLDESPFFSLVSPGAVQAAMRQLGHEANGHLTPEDAQQICQMVHARAVVHGSLTPAEGGMRLRLEADSCGVGGRLAIEEAFSSSRDLLLASLGKTADGLRHGLGEPEDSVQRFGTPLTQATTNSFSALQAFAAGEEKRARGQDHETISDYKLATDLDPEFALAYARLGTIYGNENEPERSRAAYQRAFELRAHTTERERLYLTAHYYGSALGDAERAEEVYKLWRKLYPQDLIAPNNLADIYLTLGQPEQARLMAKEAIRINPDNAFPYAGLIQADQRLGRYDEAREAWREASARKRDSAINARVSMLIVGIAQGDETLIRQQLEWARGNPRESEFLTTMAWSKAALGHLREAQDLFHRTQAMALNNGLNAYAADAGEELAQFEADFGELELARAEVQHSLKLAPGEPNVNAFAALTLAQIGDVKQAESLSRLVVTAAPQNTIFVRMIIPMTQSRLSRHRSDPETAVELLKPVAIYDLSRVLELMAIFDRAQSLLAAGHGKEAEREFQRLLDVRATCPISPYLALAHLGIARSRRITGDLEGSRAEYETFLKKWKDADTNLPVLRKARAEYRNLTVKN